MILTGVARLGRDIEVRHTVSGETVGSLVLAFNYGKKDGAGNRQTQWIDASIWGERCEKLKQYLLKGTQVSVVLEEPHIETYTKKDGTVGSSLRARVGGLEFVGSRQEGGMSMPKMEEQKPAVNDGFDDIEIPF